MYKTQGASSRTPWIDQFATKQKSTDLTVTVKLAVLQMRITVVIIFPFDALLIDLQELTMST